MKFLSLGSGSSGNAYLLSTETTRIMIDAGIPIRTIKKYLKDYGINLEDIDAVFITHDHADHIKSVHYLSNDYNKPIYATQLVHEGINRNYCVKVKPFEKNRRDIVKGETLALGNLHITPFEVPHDSTDCVGFRVSDGQTTFCLLTDVGHITPIIEEQVENSDYLVVEANYDKDMLMMGNYPAYLKGRIRNGRGHMCNKDTGLLLAQHASPRLKHVWLCHLSEENNHPELAKKTVEAILREQGPHAGVDFSFEVLKRKTPSEFYDLIP